MIRLMLANYNKKEVELLTQIIRDGILSTKHHCDNIKQNCDACQYKWLCADLASAETYVTGYARGRSDTRKRYKKSM